MSMSRWFSRSSPVLLLVALLLLPGCHYYSDWNHSYSVQVTAEADNDLVYSGTTVFLTSYYDIDHADVYITDHDWSIVSAPVSAVYTLDDYGRDADLLPITAGTYVVRYRTWYYTDHDYYDCYCTDPTGYRESFVTITVLVPPST